MTNTKRDLAENGVSSISENVNDEKKPFLSFRWTLVILAFFWFFSQMYVRTSFAVALVAMVNTTQTDDSSYITDTCPAANSSNTDGSDDTQESTGEFNWTLKQEGYILGAYFWGLFISKLIGSRIGEIVGQRATVATLTFLSSILELFAPVAASIHPMALAAIRFLIGVCYGPTPSVIQSLLSAWAPQSEISSMLTTAFSGAMMGGMIGLAISGWITNEFGWQVTFWVGGIVGLLFIPFWVILVRNTPKEHPWLSPYERKLLEPNKHITTQKTVPWKKILTSPYVGIVTFSLLARITLDTILTAEGPSFLRYKIGLDLNAAGFVCGANYLCSMLFMMMYGRISDFLYNRKYLSKIQTRKLFHFIGAGGACVILIGIGLADCNTITVIVLWELIGCVAIATSCSFNISIMDLAPNYAGTVMGITAIGNLGSAAIPLIISALLMQDNGWNKVFYLASGLSLTSCVIYVSFMTADVQSWNSPANKKEEEKSESEIGTTL